MTNHAVERCMERKIPENALRRAFDSVMPFIIRNLLKGDDRRLIVRDEQFDCSFILDNFVLSRKNKLASMKVITVINSMHVTSNAHGINKVRLVKARY